MEALLEKAIAMATAAHQGQEDKAHKPYIEHLLRVMERGQTLEEKILGILHDIVEDTPYTFEDVAKEGFSEEIIDALHHITKEPQEEYQEYIERVAAHPLSRQVKCYDLEDNMDIRRLPRVTVENAKRLNKYLTAYRTLQDPPNSLSRHLYTHIIPNYKNFDAHHGYSYLKEVTEKALLLTKPPLDPRLMRVIAAYHYLKAGAQRVAVDIALRQWFSKEELRLAMEAIEDQHTPIGKPMRSRYGEILVTALSEYQDITYYRDNYVIVQKDHLYGLIDARQRRLIYPIYQNYKVLKPLNPSSTEKPIVVSHETIAFQHNGLWGYTNLEGKEVIPYIYQDAHPFSDGLALVKHHNGFIYLNRNGIQAFPVTFTEAYPFYQGVARVRNNQQACLINTNGSPISPSYKTILAPQWINETTPPICITETKGKYGLLSWNGKEIMPPVLENVDPRGFNTINAFLCHYQGKLCYITPGGQISYSPPHPLSFHS